ncbi:hypothetical protein HZS_1793, partial [Henneguya salminicola]
MNSYSNNPGDSNEKKQKTYDEKIFPAYTFPVEISELGIKLEQKIIGLIDLEQQDVFQWIEDFRAIS